MNIRSNSTIHQSISVSGRDIVKVLHRAGIIPEEAMKQNIQVVFKIPGGGDYSNTDYEFNNEELVQISWTTTSMSNAKDIQ